MNKKLDSALAQSLVEKGIMSQQNIDQFLKEANDTNQDLQQVLLKHAAVSENVVLDFLAQRLKLSCVNLKTISVDPSVLVKVPVKIAQYYQFLPISLKDRLLSIAVSSPLDIKTQDEIRTQLGYDLEILLACSADVSDALKKYYGLAADTLQKINAESQSQFSSGGLDFAEHVEDIEKLAGDASVIKLVNQIILDAFKKRATDIHIEPFRAGVALRYRIDGILYDANVPPEFKNFFAAVISRIKIMSNLNIVERRMPQDGRAIVKVQEQVLDLRISTIPTPFGESVVIRILPSQMLFSLEKLGLAKKDLQVFEGLVSKPHGIIFVTGPTGSGKTTSLYACLNRINTKDRKIITIEDPIEYEMSGITQIQVMPEIGLDFARGLRSILRHDPDVIMVGEVRDLETAEIAIRVALTGHLVFSTLHTNDAASGVTRLIDIGVEPYLLSSSVEAFIAQRLIRLLCQECKVEDKNAPRELKELIMHDLGLNSIDEVKIYSPKGCPNCNYTGFLGRTAIYEILLVNDTIRDFIVKKTSSDQIKKLAITMGMRTLRQDGWHKVLAGFTTPEEVMKVTSSEESVTGDHKTEEALVYGETDIASLIEANNRTYSRLGCEVNIRYKIIKVPGKEKDTSLGSENYSVTKNISAGGLFFAAAEPLVIGCVIELSLEIPDAGKPIECLARVVRVESVPKENHHLIAVCFLDITGAQRIRLDRFVEAQKSK